MKFVELIELNYIEKISEKEYKCNKCDNIFSKLGITKHHFYQHEERGIKKKEELRSIALINNNKPEMKEKISIETKKAFQRDDVKVNFNKFVERMKIERVGEGNPMYGKTHTEEWRKNHSIFMKTFRHTNESKELMRLLATNRRHSKESIKKMQIIKLNKIATKETREKMSITQTGHEGRNKLTIEQINELYPTFSKEEEIRYNPDNKIKEIQTHCKNNHCKNSKENHGWFTPLRERLRDRIYALEKDNGNDGTYLYCSNECKNSCMLYGLNPNYEINKDNVKIPYTPGEYNIWRTEVLRRGNNRCQECDSTINLHCHHTEPVKIQPELSLDPSNGIILCKECHDKRHAAGTEHSNGNLANKICKKTISN